MPDHPLTLAIGGLLLDTNPDAVSDLEIKVLPLRPAWGGFALDTALFAAIAGTGWLLLTTFTHLRRYRRGRCPHCAYNRLGNYTGPCPECGHSAATR